MAYLHPQTGASALQHNNNLTQLLAPLNLDTPQKSRHVLAQNSPETRHLYGQSIKLAFCHSSRSVSSLMQCRDANKAMAATSVTSISDTTAMVSTSTASQVQHIAKPLKEQHHSKNNLACIVHIPSLARKNLFDDGTGRAHIGAAPYCLEVSGYPQITTLSLLASFITLLFQISAARHNISICEVI